MGFTVPEMSDLGTAQPNASRIHTMEHMIESTRSGAQEPPPATARRQRDPLTKALHALDLLVDQPDGTFGVRELAQRLGTAPSTTHRILGMLSDAGMVDRDDDGRYSVGFELQRLAWRVNARFPAPAIAQPILEQLTAETGETSALGFFDPVHNQLTFVAAEHTQHRLRYMEDPFQSLPIHAGASGLSILAFLAPELRDEIIRSSPLHAFTERTITAPGDLDAELAAIRARGYAISHGQRAEGAVGIGAPIWNSNGSVLGNVMVTIPEQRFEPEAEEAISQAVLRAAEELSRLMNASRFTHRSG